jgi:uncharacterized damage-inducible protein DinB
MVSQHGIQQLVLLNSKTLGELRRFLDSIDQSTYTSLNLKGRASIGQHVRHTLEFYQCLFQVEDAVNYDLRKRDVLIESNPEHAAQTLAQIVETLDSFESDRELLLKTGDEDLGLLQFPSSFARELFYVLEHAIHHMALIRVLVKDQQPDFELSEQFGVAYSTLAHRERLSTQ